MDLFRILRSISCLHIFIIILIPKCAAGNIWGWILNHPLHQSDSTQAAGPVNDTSDGLSGGSLHVRHENLLSEDLNVNCQSGKPCGRGKFCDAHYGKCERIKRRGDFCRKDNHCQRKHECVFGRCRKEIPKGQEGSRCSGDSECPESHCCARQHGEFICKPRLRMTMKCFVPAGGLDYSLNEQCPCESGLICQYEPVRTTTLPSVVKAQKNEWFQFTSDTAQMKCLPVVQMSPRALDSHHEADSSSSLLPNSRADDEFTP